jgi:hypothetical protein
MHVETIPRLLVAAGAFMMQAAEPVDPDFVRALSTSIRGIFAVQIDRFTPQKVEVEFRKAVNDPKLTSDEGFMDNLMFVVRKKNIIALRPDVETALNGVELKPLAEVSAMKTLYALGSERERALVDERFARRLLADLKTGGGVPPGPYLGVAERIGGPKTQAVLEAALPEATSRQRQAEQSTPENHLRIAQLDKVRMTLQIQALTLSRKNKILASAQPQRDVELLKLYLQRAGKLGLWGYRELVRLSSPATPAPLRAFLSQDLDSILPVAGLKPEDRERRKEQARLRAVVLFQDIKAPLLPEERRLLERDAALIRENPESYRPDWEAVLDDE